jgi:hypothetical protein
MTGLGETPCTVRRDDTSASGVPMPVLVAWASVAQVSNVAFVGVIEYVEEAVVLDGGGHGGSFRAVGRSLIVGEWVADLGCDAGIGC